MNSEGSFKSAGDLEVEKSRTSVITASQNIKGFFYAGEPEFFQFPHSQLRTTGRRMLPGPNAHVIKRSRANDWYAAIIEQAFRKHEQKVVMIRHQS